MNNIIDKIFKNRIGLEFKVIRISHFTSKNLYYVVEFLNTTTQVITTKTLIENGFVRDNFAPMVASVGYRGKTKLTCRSREYRVWHNMINRCYNPNSTEYVRYGNKGVLVDKRWHCFADFANDIKSIEGYDKHKFDNGAIYLDKDRKSSHVKIYSKNTCTFLSSKENNPRYNVYTFIAIDPNNKYYFGRNVSDFAKEHELSARQIYSVINGHQRTHKNWKFNRMQEHVETIESTCIDKEVSRVGEPGCKSQSEAQGK